MTFMCERIELKAAIKTLQDVNRTSFSEYVIGETRVVFQAFSVYHQKPHSLKSRPYIQRI